MIAAEDQVVIQHELKPFCECTITFRGLVLNRHHSHVMDDTQASTREGPAKDIPLGDSGHQKSQQRQLWMEKSILHATPFNPALLRAQEAWRVCSYSIWGCFLVKQKLGTAHPGLAAWTAKLFTPYIGMCQ